MFLEPVQWKLLGCLGFSQDSLTTLFEERKEKAVEVDYSDPCHWTESLSDLPARTHLPAPAHVRLPIGGFWTTWGNLS